ncbi:hypothetical protein N8149_00245 [Gammaproteobacteria bacterium]|nr:hypothetical protein [Gammaproteobacteria bacterium]
MKKLLFLLLLSPSIYSEVLELTCDGIYPFYLEYDLEKNDGEIEFLTDIREIITPVPIKTIKNHTKIHKLIKTDDYLRFDLRKNRLLYVQSIYINRKNLKSHYQFANTYHYYGQCVKGKVDTPKNKV